MSYNVTKDVRKILQREWNKGIQQMRLKRLQRAYKTKLKL